MTPRGGLERLEKLFSWALELSPDERPAFVERECEGDSALRDELLGLLAAEPEAGEFFDRLDGDVARAAQSELASAAQPSFEVGPYRAVELLGHGGMGAVYRAERIDGAFEQEVALKLLHLDLHVPAIEARFLAERRILATLSHPHIARLQDGGVTGEGRPYSVMEYVDGVPITRWAERERPSLEELLRQFLDVIEAVSYLHRNLVVHRDLKPSNIYVDRRGVVKLLDFGIAKLLSDEPAAGLTVIAERLLTPRYAAPEQFAGGAITTSTDVYALGLVLHELLTGRAPDAPGTSGPGAPATTLPPPSAELRRRNASRSDPSAKSPAWRRIPKDLDTICAKATRLEPERRYASAEQLGEDIERHLSGLPVRARPSTVAYRIATFARRYKAGVAAAAALAVLLALGFARERSLREEAEAARRIAETESSKATAVTAFLTDLLSSADPARTRGAELTVFDVLDQAGARLASGELALEDPEVEAGVRLALARTFLSLSRRSEARKHLERALELAGGLESESLAAAEIAEELARAQPEDGDSFRRAEALLERAVEIRTRSRGRDHPDTLAALDRLARVLRSEGRFDEAEAMAREVLADRRSALGEEHPETLLSINNVAGILFETVRFAEAAELYARALEIARRTLGDDHPETLRYGSNLGAAYLEQGLNAKAEAVYQEVVEGRVRVLGEHHLATGMSLHNLCVVLLRQARYGEAERCLSRALASRGSKGPKDAGYLFTRSFLADLLREQGRFEEAEAVYRETLAGQTSLGIPNWKDPLRTRAGLAELYMRTGRLGEAEDAILSSRAAQQEILPPEHPDLLASTLTLARLRCAQQRFDEGLGLARAAAELAREKLGPEHPATLEADLVAARALTGLSRQEEAAALFVAAHDASRKILGDNHPTTLEAQRGMAAAREAVR